MEGVLWTHVLDVNEPNLSPLRVRELSNGYGDGTAFASFGGSGRRWVVVSEDIFCRECPYQVTDLLSALINPAFATVTLDGARPVIELSQDTVTYFDQLTAGDLRQITASEPMVVQTHYTNPGTLITRAVGFDDLGQIKKLVQMTDALALPTATDYRIITLPPDMLAASSNAGPGAFDPGQVALSGTLGYLFVLDVDAGWTLDLRTGTWRSVGFPPSETTGQVVAAGYRHHDRAVYFLDADAKGRLALRRWNALRRFPDGGAVETLARLPTSWRCDERCWVSFDERGSMLVSLADPGKGTRGASFMLSWFDFTAAHQVSYRGRVHGAGPVLSRPKLFPDAAVMTYTTGDAPAHRTYSLDEFRDLGVAPTMLSPQ